MTRLSHLVVDYLGAIDKIAEKSFNEAQTWSKEGGLLGCVQECTHVPIGAVATRVSFYLQDYLAKPIYHIENALLNPPSLKPNWVDLRRYSRIDQ